MASVAAASSLGGDYKQDYLQAGSDSKAASNTLLDSFAARSGATLQVVVHSEAGVLGGPAREQADQLLAELAGLPHVVDVGSPFTAACRSRLSADGRTAYADVSLDREDHEFRAAEATELLDPILVASCSSQ